MREIDIINLPERFEGFKRSESEILQINNPENILERQLKPPVFVDYTEIVGNPVELENTRTILGTAIEIRNDQETTDTRVSLKNLRSISLPNSQSGANSTENFVEFEFELEEEIDTCQLYGLLKDFYAREIFKQKRGSFDDTPRNVGEFSNYLVTRLWDYEALDKRGNHFVVSKETVVEEANSEEKEITHVKHIEPLKERRKHDENTGTVVFIGSRDDLSSNDRQIANFTRYTDDVSATEGILIKEERPKTVSDEMLEQYAHLPVIVDGCGRSKKIILRLESRNYELYREFNELDMYFTGIALSDILSGRKKYQVEEGQTGSVGHHYRNEISAITAALNASRYKNLSLETLPGSEYIAKTITEDLIDPLSDDDLDSAQDIMIVGPPGTGKTAVTTALSRLDTGVSFVSVSSKDFLEKGENIIQKLVEYHDRFGQNHVLVIQDAEALFTDSLSMDSDGTGAPIDPERRAVVLELLNGERPTKLKFLLTINKPGYIDEALRRRFLMVYAGLPDENDKVLYERMADGNLQRMIPDDIFRSVGPILSPLIARESAGYPPAFVGKLTEMILNPLKKMAQNGGITEGNAEELIKLKAQRLKKGYPIKEIREQDKKAREIADQKTN